MPTSRNTQDNADNVGLISVIGRRASSDQISRWLTPSVCSSWASSASIACHYAIAAQETQPGNSAGDLAKRKAGASSWPSAQSSIISNMTGVSPWAWPSMGKAQEVSILRMWRALSCWAHRVDKPGGSVWIGEIEESGALYRDCYEHRFIPSLCPQPSTASDHHNVVPFSTFSKNDFISACTSTCRQIVIMQ